MLPKRVVVLIVTALAVLVLCSAFLSVEALSTAVKVVVDGQQLHFDVTPRIISGRTLVPMRHLFEHLGAAVEWNQATGTVTGKRSGISVTLHVGKNYAVVNGRRLTLDVPARIIEGRTMVPLRFISECWQARVEWIAAERTVYIDTLANHRPDSGGKDIAAITAMWEKLRPRYRGSPYHEVPAVTAPYRAGRPADGMLRDAINMVNFVRYLADLPYDVKLDQKLNNLAQHGAVLLAANDRLTHSPAQPADMEDSFYQLGLQSAQSSNISYYSYGSTNKAFVNQLASSISPERPSLSIVGSILGYMSDSSTSNISAVGHRRWILNPSLQKTGFGYAHRLEQKGNYLYIKRYAVMQAHDRSRTAQVDYAYIAWPNRNYFPLQLFSNKDPWSVSLNPDLFQAPNLEQVQVELHNLTQGKKWTFAREYSQAASTGRYLQVNNGWYGVPYCIIFRPEGAAYRSGENYKVTISGLKDLSGNAVSLSYVVKFFELPE